MSRTEETSLDAEPQEQPIVYASLVLRVVAGLIDVVVFSLLALPINYMIYGDRLLNSDQVILGPAHFVISNVVPAIVIIFCWNLYGSTLGTRIVRIRVVDANTGQWPSQVQCILRLLGIVATWVTLGMGMVLMVFDKKRQALQDKFGRTIVIREPSSR
jgi:uncharacterized RDD family membrane protein YckC